MPSEQDPFEIAAPSLACSVIRGEEPGWPFSADRRDQERFYDYARRQSVAPLLGVAASDLDWPDLVRELFAKRLREEAIWELGHRARMSELLEALTDNGIAPMVMKGTALAYSVYPDAIQRRRGDSDLIVRKSDLPAADSVLRGLGFERRGPLAPLFAYQSTYSADSSRHPVDLHWRISNASVLSAVLGYQELLERSVALPRLSVSARATGLIDAMLVAVLHRFAHLFSAEDRLIWLYDMHLIAASLTDDGWAKLTDLAAEKGMVAPLRQSLLLLRERFQTQVSDQTLAALMQPANEGGRIVRYLEGSSIRRFFMDFAESKGMRRRLHILFPTRSYLEQRFERRISAAQVPWFHAQRIAKGIARRWNAGPPASTQIRALSRPARRSVVTRAYSKLRQLSWTERRLLSRAWLLTPIMGVALRRAGLVRVLRYIERRGLVGRPPLRDDEIRRIADIVNLASRHAIALGNCLTRSALLVWLLQRQGTVTDLKIGVDPRGSVHIAHAWVEHKGVPINDVPDIGRRFADFGLPISLKSLRLE